MKTFLNKFFAADDHKSPGVWQEWPRPVSIHSLQEHHRRALIGWVANRMGMQLQLQDCASGKLIYESFANEHVEHNPESHYEYLLYLSTLLFDWLESGKDVYLAVKEMGLGDSYRQCLLSVHEENKEVISRYFPTSQAESDKQNVDEAIWKVYREVIHAATQKKFLLIHEGEITSYQQGRVICEAMIRARPDIPKARELAKQSLLDTCIPSAKVMSQLLVISEATTNILKHAEEGKLTLYETDQSIHAAIEDKGPGFCLKDLPYTTLMAGYSTKKSLGQGFTIMMKMSDQVLLATSPKGSTIILVFHKNEGVKHEHKNQGVV